MHSNFLVPTTFSIHQTKKTSILPLVYSKLPKKFSSQSIFDFSMKINQTYLYLFPIFRKVRHLAISVSNEPLYFRHFLTYCFLPFLTLIWSFCHACHWNRCKIIFWAYNLCDSAKFWYTISLEMAQNGSKWYPIYTFFANTLNFSPIPSIK